MPSIIGPAWLRFTLGGRSRLWQTISQSRPMTGRFPLTSPPFSAPSWPRWLSFMSLARFPGHVLLETLPSPAQRLESNQCALRIVGNVGPKAVLQSSTNLISWASVATNIDFRGTWSVTNTHTIALLGRFYRARIEF